jgi:hypothetical protein
MMNDIPISFDYRGKHYDGYLSEVSGAGGQTWFLNINKYHRGQLLFVNGNFVFYSKQEVFLFYENSST